MRPDALLFGESAGRVVTTASDPDTWLAAAARHGVPARAIGRTGGDQLSILSGAGDRWIDAPIAHLHEIWATSVACQLEAKDPT